MQIVYWVCVFALWRIFYLWYTQGMFRGTAIKKVQHLYPLWLVTSVVLHHHLFG